MSTRRRLHEHSFGNVGVLPKGQRNNKNRNPVCRKNVKNNTIFTAKPGWLTEAVFSTFNSALASPSGSSLEQNPMAEWQPNSRSIFLHPTEFRAKPSSLGRLPLSLRLPVSPLGPLGAFGRVRSFSSWMNLHRMDEVSRLAGSSTPSGSDESNESTPRFGPVRPRTGNGFQCPIHKGTGESNWTS